MKLSVIKGDITNLAVDAIVNAANSGLLPGGGVCGAIHRAAGPELAEACLILGGCETGRAKITPGYRLPAKHVIHAVGPIYTGEQPRDGRLLAGAYGASLYIADGLGLKTIAFPCISTGIYGYPPDEACKIAVKLAQIWNAKHLTDCIFCCFSDQDADRYRNALDAAP